MPSEYARERSRVEEFAERYLTHVKGKLARQPLLFAPWQQRILRSIFNDLDEDGQRKIRTFYLTVPKKAGKTTLAAAVGLYQLLCEDEPGAEIYSASTNSAQARIVFDIATKMVQANPKLLSRVTVLHDSLTYKDRVFKPLNNNANRAHGFNPSTIIIDELHCFQTQADREFYEALTSAGGSREEPLTLILTTAGYDSQSLCGEVDQYAQKVAAGIIPDQTFASFISRADAEDDWQDPATWTKANPNLGVSVRESYYREKAARAKDSPALVLEFQRFQLNQWVENVAQYIPLADWDACSATFDSAELEGRECYGGLDLSSTTDLSAFVLTFPAKHAGEPIKTLSFCWLPADNMRERVRRDSVPYDVWSKGGFLELTPGNVIDQDFMIRRIVELSERYRIKEINFDPWGANHIATALQNQGLKMVEFRQGMKSMSPPTKKLLTLVKQKRLAHDGHPVLRWCISNLQVETDAAENVKPTKEKSRERIDLAVALIMSLDSAVLDEFKLQAWTLDDFYASKDRVMKQIAEEQKPAGMVVGA